MKCPRCLFENPESSKFCGECGAHLERPCPRCDAPNPPHFKFCGGCGLDLSTSARPARQELSFEEKISKIQKYLPGGLTEKILAQRGKIEGERRQVTVLFADMENFTPLVKKLGPEEAYAIMDQIYEILIHKVTDYGGTVNEMTGDGILALFGAPLALEDAPQRAIRSAHAIHKEMAKFVQGRDLEPLKMRIGIHTGPVVVGTLGNNLRVEFKAVGDTVNLASRIEGLAEPGTTLVSEETLRLTEGFFRFEALGARRVKGREEPVKAYQVIAPSSRRTRFDVSAEIGLTPFVGRARELELLLDSFERVKARRGQAFTIIAEAGLGKSRLLYEFRKAIANQEVTFLEGKCLSYSRGVAYHPVLDILKSTFDLQEGESDSIINFKVRAGLKLLGVDEASTLPYLLELLSVKKSGIDNFPMSPEGKKDRILETLKRIALKGSEIRPLVMAFEDLHWIDKSSEDYLKDLLESIPGVPVFLIFTHRPEFVQTWGGRSYHNQVNLNRFSNRESLAMLAHLVGTDDIAPDLEELILEKTEGVPFFIEEFVRSLKDLKLLEIRDHKCSAAKELRDFAIPSTIQDIIMVRFDSLPDQAKEVLQTGSAIEREFSYQLIKKVTGFSEEKLLSMLSAIKDREILYERGIYPLSAYVFKHAVTREVVYGSILARKRKDIHLAIGRAIEEIHKDNIEEVYGILAEHYILSEHHEKAAECSRLAARKAEKAASFIDATAHAEKWASCLEKLPKTAELEKRIIDARTTLGFYKIQSQNFADAKQAIEPIVELALKLDYKKRLPQIYAILGIHSYNIEVNLHEAAHYLENAIKLAEETNNFIAVIFSNHYLGHVLADDCEFEKGLQHIQKGMQIVEMARTLWATAVHKSCIALTVYYQQGRIDLAYRTSSEGLRLAEKSGDLFSKTEAHVNHGVCSFGKGYFKEAEEHLLKGIALGERGRFLTHAFLGNLYLGQVHVLRADYRKARSCVDRAIYSATIERGHLGKSFVDSAKALRTVFDVMSGEQDIDLEALYSRVNENRIRRLTGIFKRNLGHVLSNMGEKHCAEAERWVMEAAEADRRHGMLFELALDTILHAELLRRKGDRAKAKEVLGTAVQMLRQCGADGWVQKYEEELSAFQ